MLFSFDTFHYFIMVDCNYILFSANASPNTVVPLKIISCIVVVPKMKKFVLLNAAQLIHLGMKTFQ